MNDTIVAVVGSIVYLLLATIAFVVLCTIELRAGHSNQRRLRIKGPKDVIKEAVDSWNNSNDSFWPHAGCAIIACMLWPVALAMAMLALLGLVAWKLAGGGVGWLIWRCVRRRVITERAIAKLNEPSPVPFIPQPSPASLASIGLSQAQYNSLARARQVYTQQLGVANVP